MSKGPSGIVPCGWCMDEFHDNCIKTIKHYDTVWYCKCDQCFTGESEEEEEVEDAE